MDSTVTWSDEVYRIFGIEKGSCLITYDLFLGRIHPEDRAAVDDAVSKAIAERTAYEIDHRICLEDGSVKVVHEIGFVYFSSEGVPLRMIGTVQDITDRHAQEQTVLEYRDQMQKLAAHNNLLVEVERKRIAQELHDDIGQLLTVLKIDMQLCRSAIPDDLPLRQHSDEMLALIEQTIAAVRNVTHNLRPPALNLGLAAALEWLTQDIRQRTDLQVVLACDCDGSFIDDRVATAAFRVAQESITNIIRHAGASKVFVTLTHDAGFLRLEIADDGCGFDVEKGLRQGGFGLLGMRERIIALGGQFAIESHAKAGTTVRLQLPVAP